MQNKSESSGAQEHPGPDLSPLDSERYPAATRGSHLTNTGPGSNPQYPINNGSLPYSNPQYLINNGPPPYSNPQYLVVSASYPPGVQYSTPNAQPTFVVMQQPPARQNFCLHIIVACVVFWLCGCIFGLMALGLALVARCKEDENKQIEARRFAKASLVVSIVGFVVGVTVFIVVVAVNN